MEWETFFDDDFFVWFQEQEEKLREEILAHTFLLKKLGPHLGRPKVDTLENTSIKNLKEIRIQYKGEPWRVLFAFDPKRRAILLVGGNKSGDKRWYKTNILIAEKRFKNYLKNMEKENGN